MWSSRVFGAVFGIVISIALILLPTLLVFKSLFHPGPLYFGDAPHFYPEGIRQLISEPPAWTDRGVSFGGINNFLFLSPLMIFYGIIGSLVGNDWVIRIVFYFPSIILAGFGTFLLARYLKLSIVVQFFTVLIYLLNTYFLLLVDGGQVGVALAYGLFPLVLLFLKRLLDVPSLLTFYLSLISLSLISLADPRVAAICVLTAVIWFLSELKIKNLIYLIPLGLAVLGVSMYWLFPTVTNGGAMTTIFGAGNIKWYDPILLFSPYWPANLFGVVTRPPIYFIGIPLLIFSGLLLDRARRTITFTILFLIFAFLSLGLPFLDKIPYGFAFRDSTKFYIPLLLFGGVLVGNTISNIRERLRKNKFVYFLLSTALYVYLLLLIFPALLGKMNFNLSVRQPSGDFQKIYENLKRETDFFRTVWVPEKHPLAYETADNPAVDGRDLATLRPFAEINASEDVFNFFNNPNFVNVARTLGVRYLILSDNPREISKSAGEQKDWQTINALFAKNPNLKKVDWGTQIPVYEISNPYPRFSAVKQLVAVVGAPPVSNIKYPVPSVYFEDGKWDPVTLSGKNPNSVVLAFNGGNKADLTMSFLQKYFVAGGDATKNEWATYSASQYLKYKYELLIRGIVFNDLDYSKGISFSTNKGEKIEFNFDVPADGTYLFAQRAMKPSNNEAIFKWETKEMNLSKGKHAETITNDSDLTIFNVAGLIPKADFDKAVSLADSFVKTYKTVDVKSLKTDYVPVQMESRGTLKYKFSMPEGNYWLIFSDNYNSLWKLKQGAEYHPSVPVYSMVNGFYAEDKWSNIGVEFKGQENFRWGIYFSVLSVLALAIIFLVKYEGKNN